MIEPSALSRPAGPRSRLGSLGGPFLALVVLEFLLGMALNLFGSLPTGSPWAVLTSSPLLDVHLVVGFLLLGIAANAVRTSVLARLRGALIVTSLGFLFGLAAFFAGLSFAFGDPSSGASYAMSVGFAGLVVEAGYLLQLGTSRAADPASAGGRPSET